MDLLSSYTQFGSSAAAYTITCALIYRERTRFFSDSITTLPIMTFLFSSLATLTLALLQHLFDKGPPLSIPWVATDLILLPAIDALWSFALFIFPALLFGKKRRSGKDYFLS